MLRQYDALFVCCAQKKIKKKSGGGYVGGSVQWNQLASDTASDTVQYSWLASFNGFEFCSAGSGTSNFLPCSTVLTALSTTYSQAALNTTGVTYPQVGSVVPGIYVNNGLSCPAASTCPSLSFDQVVLPTLTSGTWTNAPLATAYNGSYSYATTFTPSPVATFTFPTGSVGTLFIQIYSTTPSSTNFVFANMTYTVYYNGGASTAAVQFTSTGSGWRSVGAYSFTGSSSEKIVVTVANSAPFASNLIAMVNAIRLTSYDPTCDIVTTTTPASSATAIFYLPAGTSAKFVAAPSGTCANNVTLYAGVNFVVSSTTVYTASDAFLPRQVNSGTVFISAPTTGGISVSLYASVSGATTCNVVITKSILVQTTVTYVHPIENYIVTQASTVVKYPPQACQATPVPWVAAFEGIGRDRGTSNYVAASTSTATQETSTSYRIQTTVKVPFTGSTSADRAVSVALPAMLRLPQGTAAYTQGFSAWGGFALTTDTVSFGSASSFSAQYYAPALAIASATPSGTTLSGSASAETLTIPSALAVNSYVLGVTGNDGSNVVPSDLLLKVNTPVSGNHNPVLSFNVSSNFYVNCPATLTVTATDPDTTDTAGIEWLPWPVSWASPWTSPSTVKTGNVNSIQFSFTPVDTTPVTLIFGAFDYRNGSSYSSTTLTPLVQSCPVVSNLVCNGEGTCSCSNQCVCNYRWSLYNCTSYLNTAPVVSPLTISISENLAGQTYQIQAVDAQGDSFSFVEVSSTFNGTLTMTSSGLVTLSPAAYNFTQGYPTLLTVKVTDNGTIPASATYVLQITVNEVYVQPTIPAIVATYTENCGTQSSQFSATNPNSYSLSYAVTAGSSAQYGTLALSPSGSFTYQCGTNTFGSDNIPVTVTDSAGHTTATWINVTIVFVAQTPTAANLTFSTLENTTYSGSFVGTDLNNATLSYQLVSSPLVGTVVVTNPATGAFTYTPVEYQPGVYSFTYVLKETAVSPLHASSSPLTSATAYVTVTVVQVVHPPTVQNLSFSILQNQVVSSNFVASTLDPNITLYYTFTSGSLSVAQATVTPTTQTTSGAFVFTPPNDYYGTITFAYSVTNNVTPAVSGYVTVSIADVNSPPTFTTTSVVVNETASSVAATAQTLSNFGMGNAFEDTVQALSSVTVTVVSSSPSNLFATTPTISLSGLLSYTLTPLVYGNATLSYVVTDNGGVANGGSNSASSTASFTVNYVNQAPSFVQANPPVTLEDTTGQVALPFGSTFSAGPASESWQTLSFAQPTAVCTPYSEATIFFLAPVFTTDGFVRFTLNPAEYGTCNYTLTLVDDGGVANGGQNSYSPPTPVSIVITHVPHSPSFTPNFTSITVLETATNDLIVIGYGLSVSAGAANEASDVMAFTVVENGFQGYFSGSQYFATAPTVFPALVGSIGNLSAVIAAYANGIATLSVTLNKTSLGLTSATYPLTIQVTPVNDAPQFTPAVSSISLTESTTITATTIPIATAVQAGPDQALDELATQTVAFSVSTSCNASLFAQAPTVAISGTNASVSFSLAAFASTYLYPGGSCSLTFVLTDNGDTSNGGQNTAVAPLVVPLTVAFVNQPPSFNAGPTLVFQESTAEIPYSSTWATSILPGPLPWESFQIPSLAFTVVSTGTPTITFAAAPSLTSAGLLTFAINALVNGSASFQVTLSDGTLTATAVLNIVVQTQQFPLTFAVTDLTVNETSSASLPSYTFPAAIYNVSTSSASLAQTITVAGVSILSGSVLLQGDVSISSVSGFDSTGSSGFANVSFTPALYASGSVQVEVTLQSSQTTSSALFTITINLVNQPPFFTIGPDFSIPEDSGLTSYANYITGISAGNGYQSDQTVTFAVQCDDNSYFAASESPALSAAYALSFTSAVSTIGETTCTVTGTNNGVPPLSTSETFTITYTFVNHVPYFTAGVSQTVNETSGSTTFTVASWATQIYPGPPNEYSTQTVSFVVVADTPSLFAELPQLAVVGAPGDYPQTATLTYTPSAYQYGSASVTAYAVDSLNATSTPVATFAITVNFVNQPPSFVLSTLSISVNEYSGAQVVSSFIVSSSNGPNNALENAQTLTWTVTASDPSLFVLGSNGLPLLSIQNGALYYTLASGKFGSTTLTVSTQDNGGTLNGGHDTSAPQYVTLNVAFVNTPPTFTCGAPTAAYFEINGAATVLSLNQWATNILPGDISEVGLQTTSFSVSVSANSVITDVAVSNVTGTVSFTQQPLFYGSATITIWLVDSLGLASLSSCSLVVSVTEVNQQPFFSTLQTSVLAYENSGTNVFAGVFTGMSAGNGEGESAQTYNFVVTVASVNPANLFAVAPSADAASGNLTIVPTANLNGTATLSIVLVDNGGTANGGVDTSASATVAVAVQWVNQQPTFTVLQSGVTVNEYSGANSISGLFTAIQAGPANEAWQTVNFELGSLTYTGVVAKYSNGELFAVAPAVSAAGVLAFTLNSGAYGAVSFPYVLVDNGGTANGGVDTSAQNVFTITVNRVAVPPVANGDFVTVNENSISTFDIVSNDFSDWDLDMGPPATLRIDHLVSSTTANGGTVSIINATSVTYTAPLYFVGNDTFQYVDTDGSCAQSASACYSNAATVTIQVLHLYLQPSVEPAEFTVTENAVYSVPADSLLVATDPNSGDAIAFETYSLPSHGTVSIVGNVFTYTPAPYYCGPDSLQYTASVGGGASVSNPALISISVTCVAYPPTAYNISKTINENTLTSQTSVSLPINATTLNSWDVGKLTYSCSTGFSFGSFSPALGVLTSTSIPIVYNPNLYKDGVDTMACTVFDTNGLSANFYVAVTVLGPLHHPPIILQQLLQLQGFEDVPGSAALLAIDYDGNPMTYIITAPADPTICTITLNNQTGTFGYVSALHMFGFCTFNWTVFDAYNYATTIGVVQITIAPVAHAPVALNSSYQIAENTVASNFKLFSLNIDANQGTTLVYTLYGGQPANGAVQITNSAVGNFVFTPALNWYGNTTFAFIVTSSAGLQSGIGYISMTVTYVDQPPQAIPATLYVPENSVGSITLGYTDVDTPLSGMTFAISTQALNGRAQFTSQQVVQYTPNQNFFGLDAFVFGAYDGTYWSYATVSVNVSFVPYPPVANNASWTVTAGTNYTNLLPYTSPQFPISALTLAIKLQPAHGTLHTGIDLSQDNKVMYSPFALSATSAVVEDSFTYQVNDEYGVFSQIATVQITINPPIYFPPIANPASFLLIEQQSLLASVTGSDPNGFAISFLVVSSPTSGQLTSFNPATGAFVYVPNYNYYGPDSFTFVTQDQYAQSNLATISFTIQYVAKLPVVSNFAFNTTENTKYNGQLLGSDQDPKRTIANYVILSPPTMGQITSVSATGAFTYVPNTDAYGTDQFTYQAYDTAAVYSNQATVTVSILHVDQPPVANPGTFTTNRNTVLYGTLTASDPDIPAFPTTLTYYVVSSAADLTGTVYVDAYTGAFTYTPPNLFYGPTMFEFIANDGQLNSLVPAQISITVVYTPLQPFANDATLSATENTPLTATLTGSDVDGLPLTFNLPSVQTVSGGKVSLSYTGSSTFTYTPPAYFVGADSFTFVVNNGYYSSAPATVLINVARLPIPPVVSNGFYSVVKTHSIIVSVQATDADPSANLQLTNVSAPAHGTWQLLPDPPLSFLYTGKSDGTDVLTVTISNGFGDSGDSATGVITIFVSDVPAIPPVVGPLQFFGTENSPVSGQLSTLVAVAPIADYVIFGLSPAFGSFNATDLATGAFTIVPAPYVSGTFSFSYQAVDVNNGISNVATATVTLTAVNYPPVAYAQTATTPQGTSVQFTLEASSVEGYTSFTFAVSSYGNTPATSIALTSSNGVVTVTPQATFVGSLYFYFTAFDGTLTSNSALVTIIVQAVDHPPVAKNVAISGLQSASLISGPLAGSDPDGQPFTYFVQTSASNLPGQFSYDSSSGLVSFVPNNQGSGVFVLSYVTVNTLTSTPANLTLTIIQVNQPPVANNMYVNVPQNSVNNVGKASAYDPAIGFLLSLVSSTTSGSLTFSNDGSFIYTPNVNFVGNDAFTFIATDFNGLQSAPAVVTIVVYAVLTPPTATSMSIVLNEGQVYSGTLMGASIHPNNQSFVISVAPLYGSLVLVDAHTGAFNYTPNYLFFGSDSALFQLQDDIAYSSVAVLSITVLHVNHAPTALNMSITVNAGVPFQAVFDASDVDTGDTLTVAAGATAQSKGSVTVQGLEFTYLYDGNVPAGSASLSDSFSYQATDKNGLLSEPLAYVTVTVLPSINNGPGSSSHYSDNVGGANITGAAIGAVFAVLVLFALAFAAYKYYFWHQARKFDDSVRGTQFATETNPLYVSKFTEMYNPLFQEATEQQAYADISETFTPFEVDTYHNPASEA